MDKKKVAAGAAGLLVVKRLIRLALGAATVAAVLKVLRREDASAT